MTGYALLVIVLWSCIHIAVLPRRWWRASALINVAATVISFAAIKLGY